VSCTGRSCGHFVCALPPLGEARLGPGALRWQAQMWRAG
jgi:hypothetical protein